MKRKVWVNARQVETSPSSSYLIEAHWEELSGSEAQVNAKYSGSLYQGMEVKKKNHPGLFNGKYEGREFSVWSGTDLGTRAEENTYAAGKFNQEDND